jgi:hypothetical protein
MRDKHFFIIVLVGLTLLPPTARTQTLPDNPEPAPEPPAGWVRVQDLARGEEITVAKGGMFSVPCRFAGATDNELFCDSMFSGREYRFRREEIGRVRMDDKRRNMRILVGSFAAAGLVWGIVAPPNPNDGTPRAVSGLGGAAIGALAGLVVSVPAAFLIPGRLVYRHSAADGQPKHPVGTAEEAAHPSNGGESAP